jgi:N-methylhydantoinase A
MSSASDERPVKTPGAAIKGGRHVYAPEAASFQETAVYDRYRLRPGMQFDGPAIIEERESTFVVGAGGQVNVDAYGNLLVEVR